MFCSNCGKQIPKDMKFCSFCGAQQTIKNDTASVTPQTAPKADTKKPKKKSNIWILLVVVLVVFLIAKFISTESVNSDDPTTSSITTTLPQIDIMPTPNAEYEAIFSGTSIVHYKSFFNMETANFASKLDNGSIYFADYGYKDDIVKEWSETMYIPIDGYTDSQKSELKAQAKAQFAQYTSLDCCSVSYGESVYYFRITLEIKNADKPETYSKLYKAGISSSNTPISMSMTEDDLISKGFIKK